MPQAAALAARGRVHDADGRRDEDLVLARLQHVERFLVAERGVIDHVDAVLQAQLDARAPSARARRPLAARLRPTSHTAAISASFITVSARAANGMNSSPDGLIFSVSTPSRHISRAVRRNSSAPSQTMREGLAVDVAAAHVAQPAGHRQLRTGGAHARAGDVAGLDGVADHDVQPGLGGRGAEQRGEALVEHLAGKLHGLQRVLFRRDVAQILERRRVAERDVGMRLDHPRHQGRAAGIDAVGAGDIRRRASPDRLRSGCRAHERSRRNGSAPLASTILALCRTISDMSLTSHDVSRSTFIAVQYRKLLRRNMKNLLDRSLV